MGRGNIERYPISIPVLVRICIKESLEPGTLSSEIESLGFRLDVKLREGISRSLGEIARTLLLKRGPSIYCRLCGGGPYTKRGAYLHLIRIHLRDLEAIVREELDRVINQL